MKTEKWVDANGTTVYQKGRRTSKTKTLLTRGELIATKIFISGTVKKNNTIFVAPFKKIVAHE
jgi:hypothetical protein